MNGLKGAILMDLLLGLAGLTGLAALLQSKVLPTEKDYQKATLDLVVKPDDPALNLTAGKYEVFVLNDFQFGLQHLAKGSDKTLAALAQKELDDKNTATPELKVGMGDEWVIAAKKYPPLVTQFYDHASEWYVKAWPRLTDLWKAKVREQGKKLAAARPPGQKRQQLPNGWVPSAFVAGTQAIVDPLIARAGSYSLKLSPTTSTGSFSSVSSFPMKKISDNVEITAYVRSEGTDNPSDHMGFLLSTADGTLLTNPWPKAQIPTDTPLWNKIVIKMPLPENAVNMEVRFMMASKNGNIWIDDVSVKNSDKDLVLNGSFEQK